MHTAAALHILVHLLRACNPCAKPKPAPTWLLPKSFLGGLFSWVEFFHWELCLKRRNHSLCLLTLRGGYKGRLFCKCLEAFLLPCHVLRQQGKTWPPMWRCTGQMDALCPDHWSLVTWTRLWRSTIQHLKMKWHQQSRLRCWQYFVVSYELYMFSFNSLLISLMLSVFIYFIRVFSNNNIFLWTGFHWNNYRFSCGIITTFLLSDQNELNI